MDLITNRYHLSTQHPMTAFYNQDDKYLLRGKNLMFKHNSRFLSSLNVEFSARSTEILTWRLISNSLRINAYLITLKRTKRIFNCHGYDISSDVSNAISTMRHTQQAILTYLLTYSMVQSPS